MNRETLQLNGSEIFDIHGIESGLSPGQEFDVTITRSNGNKDKIKLKSRIDTAVEVTYFKNGGILQYVLRKLTQ